MTTEVMTPYWLPIRFFVTPKAVLVKWMDFGTAVFSDPFFHQTVRRLRKNEPPAAERTTSLATLLEMTRGIPEIAPAGIIFHISRCGSTLIANTLKTAADAVVLSEAAPVGLLFRSSALRNSAFPAEGRDDARRMLLNSVVGLFAHDALGRKRKVVIKCHTIGILEIMRIREFWPNVPFVVVIRDPAEVIVSNIAKPAGWVKARRNPRYTKETLGWQNANAQRMPVEEYCARGIAQFCDLALPLVGAGCKVIDYSELNGDSIRRIAEWFGIALPQSDSETFQHAIGTYSKDPGRKVGFRSDRQRKHEICTHQILDAAQRWAWDDYTKLRGLAAW